LRPPALKLDLSTGHPVVADTEAVCQLKHWAVKKLDDLIALAQETDPAAGEETSRRKDFKAFQALQICNELVNFLAGWAVAHTVGLALAGRRFVPLQPSGTREHPEYRSVLAEVNQHRHELEGDPLVQLPPFEPSTELEPQKARRVLINLLKANPGAFPVNVNQQFELALDALDYGEVDPLLRPVKGSRKVGLRELQLQLQALGFVQFRRTAYRAKKYEAQRVVADAYGVSPDALQKWEQRLRKEKEFGGLRVAQILSRAKNSGEWVAELNRRRESGEPGHDRDVWSGKYDDKTLGRAAKRFQALQRETAR
jgi:hypothetical protein